MSSQSSRLEAIDALRGFALMGLFIVHMVEYFELYWLHPEPGPIHTWVFLLFAGKSHSIFALLFGFSFYVMVENPEKIRRMSSTRFLWRMLLLFLIGYLHNLIYSGDILQTLAVAGMLLVVIAKLNNRWLLICGITCLLQLPSIVQYALALNDSSYTQPKFWALMANNFAMFAHGTFGEVTHYNAWAVQHAKITLTLETGGFFNILGFFILGLWLARTHIMERAISKNIRTGPIALTLLLLSVAFYWATQTISALLPIEMPRWTFTQIAEKYTNIAMVGAMSCSIFWAYNTAAGSRLLKYLAPCGRMSLTLYTGQSLMFVPVFFGYGLAMHASMGQTTALLIGLAAWVAQMIFANLWFCHFTFGPVEYVWRKLTYGH